MADKEFPEWATDLDKEIVEILNSELIMTPAVIAENIDRSRGAVSRRLGTLEAGGLVEKHGRGKYKITSEGSELFDSNWTTLSEEERKEAAREEKETRKRIRRELGMTQSEFYSAVTEEHNRLKTENPEVPEDELLAKAFEIVEKKHRDEENTRDN
jgi:DNA-binding transcriptional regulator GbsR (MarR family)